MRSSFFFTALFLLCAAAPQPRLIELKPSSNANEPAITTPFACDFDADGNLYFVEYKTHRLRMIGRDNKLITLAGTGTAGSAGDGGPADQAQLNSPHNLAIHKSGDIYIADSFNSRVRKVDAKTRIISTFAGTGKKGFSGDGARADAADFNETICIAFDPSFDHLYIVDIGNRRIRSVDMKTTIVTTVAGNGQRGIPKDDAPAADAPLVDPRAIAVDKQKNLYILERSGNALRMVNPEGRIRTLAGTGKPGSSGDDGPALAATLNGPKFVCIAPGGDLLIADTENHVVRRYSPATGVITRIAGTGKPAKPGDGILATESPLNKPHGVTVGPNGVVYIADSENNRLIKIRK